MSDPKPSVEPILSENDIARFWSKVEKSEACWSFANKPASHGYCQFGIQENGKTRGLRAHRVAWLLTFGTWPSVLDHLCRNRACINPSHLEDVSNRENVLRGISRAAENAKKTECPNGHQYDRIGSNGQRRCSKCQKKHAENYDAKFYRVTNPRTKKQTRFLK